MKRLAVIGASYLQLPLVLKAKEMGIQTVCFAVPEGAVCRDHADEFIPVSIIEKERILELCRERRIDGVASIASDVAVPTVSHVAMALGLTGNTEESARISTNKYAMRRALAAGGVRCPSYALARSPEDAGKLLSEVAFPAIVKPCDRSGSMGVTKVDHADELPRAIATALDQSFCREAVVEQFIADAREISIEGISWNGEYHPLAVTDKVISGPPHYVEIGHHQPSTLPSSVIDEALRQVHLGIKALDIRFGATHPELMITPSGEVFMTEIGARMGGDFIGSDLVRLSTGYDFLRGVVEVALGIFTVPEKPLRKHSGVWFYSCQTPQVPDIIREHPDYLVRWELSGTELKPLTRSADRAGYFIYQSDARIDIKPFRTTSNT